MKHSFLENKDVTWALALKMWWWIFWRSLVVLFIMDRIESWLYPRFNGPLEELILLIPMLLGIWISFYIHKIFVNQRFGSFVLRLMNKQGEIRPSASWYIAVRIWWWITWRLLLWIFSVEVFVTLIGLDQFSEWVIFQYIYFLFQSFFTIYLYRKIINQRFDDCRLRLVREG